MINPLSKEENDDEDDDDDDDENATCVASVSPNNEDKVGAVGSGVREFATMAPSSTFNKSDANISVCPIEFALVDDVCNVSCIKEDTGRRPETTTSFVLPSGRRIRTRNSKENSRNSEKKKSIIMRKSNIAFKLW